MYYLSEPTVSFALARRSLNRADRPDEVELPVLPITDARYARLT